MTDNTSDRLRRELVGRRKEEKRLRIRLKAVGSRIKKIKDALRRRAVPKPGLWHPHAIKVPYTDSGPFIRVPARVVFHTTEGSSLPKYSGTAPHITFDPRNGKIYQHMPLNVSALSLEHPPGTVETNHAHAIQIELIGFARETQNWPRPFYQRIAELCRWIEASTGVKRSCGVEFVGNGATNHMNDGDWLQYQGYCGHQHVPNNHHWDPGKFSIKEVI